VTQRATAEHTVAIEALWVELHAGRAVMALP